MFSRKELNSISDEYFLILERNPLYVRIQSKCTRHFWRVYASGVGGNKKCLLQHAHGPYDGFHDQCYTASLQSAMDKIRSHDRYQKTHRPPEIHRWDEYKPVINI